MMREPVCIILNEREPNKLKAVEKLCQSLESKNITTCRIPITPDILEAVLIRCPKIVVLDYLLGDYSTGLDVLNAFNTIPDAKRPKVFFLTDEPSVQVAVNALQNGAINYFELEASDSISKLCNEIESNLREELRPLRQPAQRLGIDDLVAQSKASLLMVNQAQLFKKQDSPLCLILGKPGSGLTTLACALQDENSYCGAPIDLRFYDKSIVDLIGFPPRSATNLMLGKEKNLVLENIDQDGGDLLEHISKYHKSIWPQSSASCGKLIVTTSDDSSVAAWQRLTPVTVIKIPDLEERSEDIAPLCQRFFHECEKLIGKKLRPLPPAIVQNLSNRQWPSQVKQLRSVLINALFASVSSDSNILDLIDDNWELWQSAHEEPSQPIDRATASAILEVNNMNYRIAAAKIGCSIAELHSSLNSKG